MSSKYTAGLEPEPSAADGLRQSRKTIEVDDCRCELLFWPNWIPSVLG